MVNPASGTGQGSPVPLLLALADDTTGALEVAARLAQSGLRTMWRTLAACRIGWQPIETNIQALVLDTRSRHLPSAEAAGAIDAALQQFPSPPPHIYKKTDSTLRGPIAAEIEALRHHYPSRPVVFVPAYPALGRTVRDGHLYVHGVPLGDTHFAKDALTPMASGDIRNLFPKQATAAVRAPADLPSATAQILICDASTDAELTLIAQAIDKPVIAAGSAAFGTAWAAELPIPRTPPPSFPTAARGLLVCGSRHPASLAQIDETNPDSRWPVHTPAPHWNGPAHDIAARLAVQVREQIEATRPEALIIFGGDTAAAILHALNVEQVLPCGELLPGVPVSLIPDPPLVLVTKAGGFGHPGIVRSILDSLQG